MLFDKSDTVTRGIVGTAHPRQGQYNTPEIGNRRKHPTGNETSPQAAAEGHATTGRAGASSRIVRVLRRRKTREDRPAPQSPPRELRRGAEDAQAIEDLLYQRHGGSETTSCTCGGGESRPVRLRSRYYELSWSQCPPDVSRGRSRSSLFMGWVSGAQDSAVSVERAAGSLFGP